MLVVLLFFPVFELCAQERESTLVNRLLKPDMSLKNSAERKQFTGFGTVAAGKTVSTRTLYSREQSLEKTFPAARAVAPREFAASRFPSSDSVADVSTRSRLPRTDTVVVTPPAPGVRPAAETTATVQVGEFAGSRPFLVQGKSQKALQTKNKPLTIEQVRELLNKNK